MMKRLDARASAERSNGSWVTAVAVLVIEAAAALALGLIVGHPWLALAIAFWGAPVFVLYVPLSGKQNRLDARVLRIGTRDEEYRTTLLNFVVFIAILVAIVVAVTVALVTA